MGIQPETARDICTLALKEAGVLGLGQTANAEDINDAFTLLGRMLAQWQQKRWVVPSLYDIAAIGNGLKSNTIGPGQFWNAQRPSKVQAAYFIQNIPGSLSSNANAVSFPLTMLYSYEDYANKVALKNLPSWPVYCFYDNQFPVGNVFIWPIPDSTYTIHLILKSPIGFTTEIESVNVVTNGIGYTPGNYNNVPIINTTGYGSDAIANFAINAFGQFFSIVMVNGGDGYIINDQLTVHAADVGGTGNGFVMKVIDVTDSLDAVMTMPPEYYEAIHYNLAMRLMSMYNYPADPFRSALAKGALNTIRVANTQISNLSMPSALRNRRQGSSYIFSVDAR